MQSGVSPDEEHWYQQSIDSLHHAVVAVEGLWNSGNGLSDKGMIRIKKIVSLGLSTRFKGERISYLRRVYEILDRQGNRGHE